MIPPLEKNMNARNHFYPYPGYKNTPRPAPGQTKAVFPRFHFGLSLRGIHPIPLNAGKRAAPPGSKPFGRRAHGRISPRPARDALAARRRPAWAGAALRRVFSVAWLRGYFSRSTHLCYIVYAASRRSVHKQFQNEPISTGNLTKVCTSLN